VTPLHNQRSEPTGHHASQEKTMVISCLVVLTSSRRSLGQSMDQNKPNSC
jgi:hypothetical protein